MPNGLFKEVSMFGKRVFIFFSFVFVAFLVIGCSNGAQFEGEVENFLTNSPANNVTVLAVTKTDIKEQQKYARLNAKTNSTGSYLISKALKSQRYELSVEASQYATTEIYVTSPGEDVTKAISEKIFIAELPRNLNNGFYVYPSMQNLPITELGENGLSPDYVPRVPSGNLILSHISNERKFPGSSFYKISSYKSVLKGNYDREKNARTEGTSKTFGKNGKYITYTKVGLAPGVYAIPYGGYSNYYYFINVIPSQLAEIESKANDILKNFWAHCYEGNFDEAMKALSQEYIKNTLSPLGGLNKVFSHLKDHGFEEISDSRVFLVGQAGPSEYLGIYFNSGSNIKRTIKVILENNELKIDSLDITGWPSLVAGQHEKSYSNAFESEAEKKNGENWSYINGKYADYKVDNNSYVITTKTDNDYIWAYDTSKTHLNFSYSADITRKTNNEGYYGLIFNYSSNRKCSDEGFGCYCDPAGYGFFITNKGRYSLEYECGKSGGLHKVKDGYSFAINNAGINKVRIDFNQGKIVCYVNGSFVTSLDIQELYKTKRFTDGFIGVYGTNGITTFDNLEVLSLAIK
jgi:hypothetical protein